MAEHPLDLSRWSPKLCCRSDSDDRLHGVRARRVPEGTKLDLARDLAGGGLAAMVALPHGLALAAVIGLPPESGVLASIVTALSIGMFGRAPLMLGGTAAISVPFLASAFADSGLGGVMLVGFLCSVVMIVFGSTRLPELTSRIDPAVATAFLAGVGLLLIRVQWVSLVSLDRLQSSALPVLTLALLVCFATLLAHRLGAGGLAPLIGVVLGMAVAHGFLGRSGTRALPGAPITGSTPGPGELTALPAMVLDGWSSMRGFEGAEVLDLVVVGLLMGVVLSAYHSVVGGALGRASAIAAVGSTPLSPLRRVGKLRLFGLTNLVAALLALPPSVAMPARTILAVRAGARSSRVYLAFALTLSVSLVVLGRMPEAPAGVLSGIVLWSGLCLIDARSLRAAWWSTDPLSRVLLSSLVLAVPLLGPAASTLGLMAVLWFYAAYRRFRVTTAV